MDQGEDGGVSAYAERDGENHRGGKAGRLAKLAQSEFEIVHVAPSLWTGGFRKSEHGRRVLGGVRAAGDLSLRLKSGSVRDDANLNLR